MWSHAMPHVASRGLAGHFRARVASAEVGVPAGALKECFSSPSGTGSWSSTRWSPTVRTYADIQVEFYLASVKERMLTAVYEVGEPRGRAVHLRPEEDFGAVAAEGVGIANRSIDKAGVALKI